MGLSEGDRKKSDQWRSGGEETRVRRRGKEGKIQGSENRGEQIDKWQKIMRHVRHECLFIQTICRNPHTAQQAFSPRFIAALLPRVVRGRNKARDVIFLSPSFSHISGNYSQHKWKKYIRSMLTILPVALLWSATRRSMSNYLCCSFTTSLTGIIITHTLPDSQIADNLNTENTRKYTTRSKVSLQEYHSQLPGSRWNATVLQSLN